MQKIILQVNGIHCKSCKSLIEGEISLQKGVEKIEVDRKTGRTEIIFNEKEISRDEIVKEIEALNYQVKSGKIIKKGLGPLAKPEDNKWNRNLIIAGSALVVIAVLYFIVTNFGFLEILGKLNEPNLSYPLIFVIGLLASFHCIGMCGGIVMAYTTRFCASVKGNKNVSLSHIYYNLGRIIAYTLTGAVLGGIGSFFAINSTFTGIVTLLAGLFMLAVGLSLLARLSILDKITGILPVSFARLFSSQLHASKPRTPFVIGFLNGFIPCGPLQALQIYALASGSALRGGLSLVAFGLGTSPLMLGFGNIISMFSQSRLKQVMKVSGIIVIILGLMTINRSFGSFSGANPPQNTKTETANTVAPINGNNNTNQNTNYQTANMDLTYQGYVPNTLTVKKGIPVKWVINAKEISGCTSEILLPAFNIDRNLKKGENVIEFTPKVAGTYKFSCGMQMVWGKFIVTE